MEAIILLSFVLHGVNFFESEMLKERGLILHLILNREKRFQFACCSVMLK